MGVVIRGLRLSRCRGCRACGRRCGTASDASGPRPCSNDSEKRKCIHKANRDTESESVRSPKLQILQGLLSEGNCSQGLATSYGPRSRGRSGEEGGGRGWLGNSENVNELHMAFSLLLILDKLEVCAELGRTYKRSVVVTSRFQNGCTITSV